VKEESPAPLKVLPMNSSHSMVTNARNHAESEAIEIKTIIITNA
jgi:hypothetical protein